MRRASRKHGLPNLDRLIVAVATLAIVELIRRLGSSQTHSVAEEPQMPDRHAPLRRVRRHRAVLHFNFRIETPQHGIARIYHDVG